MGLVYLFAMINIIALLSQLWELMLSNVFLVSNLASPVELVPNVGLAKLDLYFTTILALQLVHNFITIEMAYVSHALNLVLLVTPLAVYLVPHHQCIYKDKTVNLLALYYIQTT